MLLVLLVASLTLSVSESHDQHLITQDTTPPYSNVTVMTYSGGRRKGMELGCHELRSKRFISDGMCTTSKPIKEVVCADWCIMPPGQVPGQQSPTYMSKIDWREWAKRQKPKKSSSLTPSPLLTSNNNTVSTLLPQRWRCVEGPARKRRVTLICKDGSRRMYRVKVVKRCKCTKNYTKQQDKKKRTPRLDRSEKRNA